MGSKIPSVSQIISGWNNDERNERLDWAAAHGFSWRRRSIEKQKLGRDLHKMIAQAISFTQAENCTVKDILDNTLYYYTQVDPFNNNLESNNIEKLRFIFNIFLEWGAKYKIRPIAIEEKIFSEKYGFGGVCDFKGYIDQGEGDVKVLIDWKNTSAVTEKHKVQLAAYNILHEEKYGKDDPFQFFGAINFHESETILTCEHYTSLDDIRTDEEFFLALLNMYEIRTRMNGF